jgi:tRNA-dihydrouridine synthase
LVDINCGCPSVRITGNEAGSFLLKNPEKVVEMIKLLKKKKFIVTAKIRLGFDDNNVIEIAKMIEKAGADAITVHARRAIDSNNIPADWNWIVKVKENVKIPVIGNGDVRNGADAEKMLKICDGVMIARAAIGDPTIFERINYYLKTGKEKEIDYKKNIKLFIEYLKIAKKYDIIDMPRIKYLGSNFLKNFSGASKFRNELHGLKDFDELNRFLRNVYEHIQ